MKCDNCGGELDSNLICLNCGRKKEINVQSNIDNNMDSNSISNSSKEGNFFGRNKKIIIGSGIGIIILAIFFVLYAIFFGFEKLEWDDKYKSVSLDYVTQSNLKIGFDISDRDKVEDVKIKVTCGNYEINKREITWNLKEATGNCEIELSYKMKKIKKEFTIIPLDIEKKDLALIYNIDLESDEDLDFDGLTNKQEKEYGTNPLLADTDMDGLEDGYEILTSKTDPLKADTDEDGLDDYDEIELGLDPLKGDSKSDGVKDGDRTLEYEYSNENVKLTVNGKGNIASSIVNVNESTKISSKTGMIDKLYSVYSAGEVNDLDISISYTNEELVEHEIVEDNLTIYAYNAGKEEYERVNTKLDKNNKVVFGSLKKGGNYVVGDGSKIVPKSTSQILFILDNSWSMYSNEQYEEITGGAYTGNLDGFDAAGLRFTLTGDLINKLSSKGHSIGLSEFRDDYANISKIGTSKATLKKNLENMYGNFASMFAGTNIRAALENGMNEFDKDSDGKYIIILTDGQDTGLKSSASKIIDKANDKNVKICSIGFGGGSLNVELSNISNATGCKFFSSSDSSGLEELFNNVETELSDDLIDVDNDGESDGILLADSGFIASRDGFSFPNYVSNFDTGGHCYGMATFAELYYLKKLPLNVSIIKNNNKDRPSSYAYDLRNTYFKNYDNLYSYNLKTNALKYGLGFDLFNEEVPVDIRTIFGTKYGYNQEYVKEIKDSNLYDINEDKTTISKKEQLEKWGVNYETVEHLMFNEDKMQKSNVIDNEDKQLFNAIYAAFIKQMNEDNYVSSMNATYFFQNLFDSIGYLEYPENIKLDDNAFINIMTMRLKNGDPLVIGSVFGGGYHAINAISLAQDIENPNYYYIGVYDNNYPGEKRYVDLECKRGKCVTVANEYYSNSGNPISFTPSLEYDLEYYKDYIK